MEHPDANVNTSAHSPKATACLLFSEDEIPAIHRESFRRILALLLAKVADRAKLMLVRENGDCTKLVVSPSRPGASRIEISFFGGGDARDIGIATGQSTFLYLPTDTYGEHAKEWRQFLDDFIAGVIMGTLTETLERRGDNLVNVKSRIRLGNEEFTFNRTIVPNLLKGLFQSGHMTDVSYAPYAE